MSTQNRGHGDEEETEMSREVVDKTLGFQSIPFFFRIFFAFFSHFEKSFFEFFSNYFFAKNAKKMRKIFIVFEFFYMVFAKNAKIAKYSKIAKNTKIANYSKIAKYSKKKRYGQNAQR